MDTPDIKAGKYYNLKLLCVLRKDKLIAFETPAGGYMLLRQCDLELVTPIEESEPYYVEDCYDAYCVCRDSMHVVDFNTARHPHAKEAAEAERDRLNAEHRKEPK